MNLYDGGVFRSSNSQAFEGPMILRESHFGDPSKVDFPQKKWHEMDQWLENHGLVIYFTDPYKWSIPWGYNPLVS